MAARTSFPRVAAVAASRSSFRVLRAEQGGRTTDVPPTASVLTRHASDRADQVRPSLDPDEALANAPEPARGAALFKVPRVIG